MTTPQALSTRALDVGYRTGRRACAVLERLDLNVRVGELVCLLGPNGAGKSTLLRTLARMQPALAGRVDVGGQDIARLSPADLARRLGVVLTETRAIGSLPAQRVVEMGRYPHSGWLGVLSSRDAAVVEWAIDAVGARHLAARDFARISDGERQRIMIARALAQEPIVLLLDEPTAFLDVPSRVELMGLLRRLARDEGLAVVLSSHDLELALRTADTVWLVTSDRQVHCGAPEDVVLAGAMSAAFESASIRFRPDERTFRLVTGTRGRATVHGGGLGATLATAVLEREGYAVCHGTDADLIVAIDPDGTCWSASRGSVRAEGGSYAALAEFARHDAPNALTVAV